MPHLSPLPARPSGVRGGVGRGFSPRRGLLSLLVAIASLLAPALAQAAEQSSYRTESLPSGAPVAGAARGGSATAGSTIELRATKRFSMVGLRWASAHAQVSGKVRAQRTDGSWTGWLELESQQGTDGVVRGADGAEAAAGEARQAKAGLLGSTEPLWTGPARRLQIRLDGARPKGLRAAFVDVTGDIPAVRASAARAKQTDDFAGIQPRAAWDPDNECAPRSDPGLGSVQAVVVHHTVGTNDYSLAQVPAIILGICKFHRNGNGWNDIGYNVLVDRFGGAWEGRAGGITQPVVGAQAQGFNAVTAGVSMLGDFQAVAPSPAQLATVGRVAAWRLAVAGVPRSGTVDLTSAGGSLSRFKSKAVATLPRVMGHRDVGLTECPGGAAYALLDGVRAAVSAASPIIPASLPAAPAPTPQPVKITISTQRTVGAGSTSVVKGTAKQGSAPLKSATVALQVSADGTKWQSVTRDRTTSSGAYSLAHRFSRSWKLRVVRTDGDGGTSSTVAMNLVPKLTLTVPKRMKVGKRVVLRGTISPGRGPVRMTIERRSKSGKYVAGSTVAVKQSGRNLSVAVTPHSATLYRFRLVVAASEFNTAAKSSLRYGRAVTGSSSGGATVGT
ncbi:MAG: N-acetylmuramoyl-L-alanine amidase [Solirubrobacteraceae bacterium]|nr:N-acetylmuramoyl-L-alanine amidase [Solirubrobacteraceae bacterium]